MFLASNDKLIANEELERIWKEDFLLYRSISWHPESTLAKYHIELHRYCCVSVLVAFNLCGNGGC
jgi:hypothetical protein